MPRFEMTPEEHEHLQSLEGKVKRYRNRIALLKEALILAKSELKLWQSSEGDEAAWRQYEASEPMQKINAALARNVETDSTLR